LGPLNDNPLEYFTRVACEYGDIAGLRVLNFKTIFINHPDLIEEVLVTNARKYSKGRVLRANRHVFGEGLLTSEGDFWLRQRRLAQPAFHRARIASYAATMVDYTERMVEGWRGGEERDAHQEMMRLTLEIVAKTLFDAEVDAVLGDRAPTLDDLPKLRYTGHVITESLRLYPAAWGMARLAVEDHEIAGYAVTKGMGVAMAQWVVHRDPRWYDAPEEFRPE